MNAEKAIQIAVARADLFACATLRWLGALAALTVLLLLAVIAFRSWAVRAFDPYLTDYDAPGVDITSEGPDDDCTQEWYDAGGDGHE